jgi:D-cysteine desulfhydrase
MPNFSRALGDKVRVYIKRDDLLPGCAGGSKTRKLDFCIADALAKGADTLITCGSVQSNHCRLTLAWSRKEGLECHLVLEERGQESYRAEASGNNFLFQLMDADSITAVPRSSPMPEQMEKLAVRLKDQGRTPYIIPGGASNALGALGYAACAQETGDQLLREGIAIHTLIVPSGSAGTQAGIVAGMHDAGTDMPVLGINVSRPKDVQEELVIRLARATAELAGVKQAIPASAVNCCADYVGPGYALPTDGMVEAVKLLARTEGILLDPVYSGKAMAGLIDLVRKDAFPKGSGILFLHTGGSPALYAYMDSFR